MHQNSPKTSRSKQIDHICPVCGAALFAEDKNVMACRGQVVHRFPVVADVPVLINDSNSVFAISDFTPAIDQAMKGFETSSETVIVNHDSDISKGMHQRQKVSPLRTAYRRFAHSLTEFEVKTDRLHEEDAFAYLEGDGPFMILVVGAGDQAMRAQLDGAVFIYTDVAHRPDLDSICDAHDLPYPDASFDAVIATAVLEHVADPPRVVAEFHRVLKPRGIVAASTPFLQPIHLGAYDFTRYTLSGYRRLFRAFDEIKLEPVLGPGSTFAYALQYLFTSFAGSRRSHAILNFLGLLVSRPFKFLDKLRLKQRAALRSAAGYAFIGRRSDKLLSDRALVRDMSDRLDW